MRPWARNHSMPSDATSAATSAVQTARRRTAAGGDAGEGDVADAVAHQREALLHEEHADERRGAPRRRAGDSASCMYSRSNGHGSGMASPAGLQPRGRSWRCTPRLTPVASSSAGGPSNATRRCAARARGRGRRRPRRARGTPAARRGRGRSRDTSAVAETLLRLGVDAGDRLVEDQQLGIADERLGDERALLLAARQLGEAPARSTRAHRSRACSGRSRPRSSASGGATSLGRASRPAATTSATVAGSDSLRRRPLRHVADD